MFESSASKTAVTLLCLCLITAGLFYYSLVLRRPWVTSSKSYEADGEAAVLIFVKNWYREGFWHLRGAMYWDSLTIDKPVRELYCSFPPTVMIPIFLAGKILGREPTLEMTQNFTLTSHLLLTVVLFLTIFVFTRQIGYSHWNCFLCSLVPILLSFLTPVLLAAFRLGYYFVEEAILLPFATYILLETLRDDPGRSRCSLAVIAVLQGLVAMAGTLTEWLMAFVILGVYLNRLARGQMGSSVRTFLVRSVAFWWPFAVGILLILGYIYTVDGFALIASRFRSTVGRPELKFFPVFPWHLFWVFHAYRAFGLAGIVLIWGAALCFVAVLPFVGLWRILGREIHPAITKSLCLIFPLLASCFAYTFLLREHATFPLHFFVCYKFAIPFDLLTFVVIPVLLTSLPCVQEGIQRARVAFRRGKAPGTAAAPGTVLAPVSVLLAGAYMLFGMPDIVTAVSYVPGRPDLIAAAKFVGANTAYEDVVFTAKPKFTADIYRVYVPYSMKEIYPAESVAEIYNRVKDIPGDYVVDVLSVNTYRLPPDADLRKLIERASGHVETEEFQLDKIRKSDFLALCKELAIP